MSFVLSFHPQIITMKESPEILALCKRLSMASLKKHETEKWLELKRWARKLKQSKKMTWKEFSATILCIDNIYYIQCLSAESDYTPLNKKNSLGKVLWDALRRSKENYQIGLISDEEINHLGAIDYNGVFQDFFYSHRKELRRFGILDFSIAGNDPIEIVISVLHDSNFDEVHSYMENVSSTLINEYGLEEWNSTWKYEKVYLLAK